MDFARIEKQLKALDYNWFNSKKTFFEAEEDYNPETNLIEVKTNSRTEVFEDSSGKLHPERIYDTVLNFYDYCWNAEFDNSISSLNPTWEEEDNRVFSHLNRNVASITEAVSKYLENTLKNISDIELKHKVLTRTLKKIKEALPNNVSRGAEYIHTLVNMHQRITAVINAEYGYIVSQYEIHNEAPSVKPELSPELCEKICVIPFGGITLAKSFQPLKGSDISAGNYLFKIAQPNPSNKKEGFFGIECGIGDFHDFLIALSNHIRFNFKELQNLECFRIDDKPFSHGAFKTHKTRAKKQGFVPFPALDQLFS